MIVAEGKWRKWRVIFIKNVDVITPVVIGPKGQELYVPAEALVEFYKWLKNRDNKKHLIKGIKIVREYYEKRGTKVKSSNTSVVDVEILEYLKRPNNYWTSHTPSEIARAIGRDPVYVWDRLQVLVKKGLVKKIGRGRYIAVFRWK